VDLGVDATSAALDVDGTPVDLGVGATSVALGVDVTPVFLGVVAVTDDFGPMAVSAAEGTSRTVHAVGVCSSVVSALDTRDRNAFFSARNSAASRGSAAGAASIPIDLPSSVILTIARYRRPSNMK
jgi:hypothetical protein